MQNMNKSADNGHAFLDGRNQFGDVYIGEDAKAEEVIPEFPTKATEISSDVERTCVEILLMIADKDSAVPISNSAEDTLLTGGAFA